MRKDITSAGLVAAGIEAAWEDVSVSFERFCLRLSAGVATLAEMTQCDAAELCGPRHGRNRDRRGYRWGRTIGKLGFHGGNESIERPRVRARDGVESTLPSWEAAQAEDAGSAAMSNVGVMPQWHCVGPRQRCKKPPRASGD